MVKRTGWIILFLLGTVYVLAANKPYYDFPLVEDLHSSSRLLIYDVFNGTSSSKNITGTTLRNVFETRSAATLKHDQSAHIQYSTVINTRLSSKEQTGVASSLVVSHNALGNAHSGHFTAANPHSDSKSRTAFTLYSAARQLEINNKAPKFSNHTGVRYPVFAADNSYTWTRPLELCGTNPATAIFDGAPGIQGERGFRGYTGLRGFRGYSGARGFRGYSGLRGYRGYSGAKGTAATITIGTVATLSPSTPAYVTNVGTSSAAVFNLGIPQGQDGSASITQAQILAVLDDQSTGILTMQGSADADVKHKLLYASTSGVSLYITSAGLIYALDTAGKLTWGWDNNNKTMKFSNWSTGSTRVNLTIDQKGQIHQYATDGKTVIFERHTSGRQRLFTRGGKLIEYTEPDGNRTMYRPDGVTVRFQNRTSGTTVL